ncbi:MAG: aminotransferase class V-fold PLP-dependent enzyme [Oscillospiraceae bacterium]|nr:aminotransferase class V-fold PLP-dependent enzyme [Oscillospiraceae bacterium]
MRILIFTAATGGGHKRTAKAMEDYFLNHIPGVEVRIVDAIKEVNKVVDKTICGSYEFMAMRAPKLYGAIYDQTQKEGRDVSKPLSAMACRKLLPVIDEFDPDVIITTHPFAGEMVSHLKRRHKIDQPLVSIMTDYGPHRSYLAKGVDAYIVPAPECVEPMVQLGIQRPKIHPYGIPVFSVFHPIPAEDVPALREQLGLDPDPTLPTLLLMAGSFGVTNILEIFKSLMELEEHFQLVIITGKNKKLYEAFEKVVPDAPKPVTLVYFTDVVQNYMQCSDMIITKPGGLTISEAIACDLPMVLFNAIPGQEEDNAEFLVNRGMAVRIGKNQNGAEVIQRLLKYPEKLALMHKACHAFDTSNCRENLTELVKSMASHYREKRQQQKQTGGQIYLDNSATTQVCQEAAEKVVDMMVRCYGNPSSLHQMGFAAEQEMTQARETIAKFIGAKREEIVFTSGGTEANNLAIFGAVQARRHSGKKVVTTAIEHPSVLQCMYELEKRGYEVVRLRPDSNGVIPPEALLEAIDDKTVLVSMMLVNNETGAIQPIEAAAKAIAKKKSPALFHVDGVQALGKLPIKVKRMKIDLLSMSGHKIHGPKGVGALYLADGVRIPPMNYGGGQERGLRSGTEAVPAICGFGAAVKALPEPTDVLPRMQALSDYCRNALREIPGIVLNSPPDALPYIVNFSTQTIRSETMVHFLAARNISVSGGSACSGSKESHVLTAMNLPRKTILTSIRVSFSQNSTEHDVDALVQGVREGMETLASGKL